VSLKLKDIEVGGRYHARVSGTLAVVRVVELKQIPPAYHLPKGNLRTVIYAVNEATGRRITVRSPQRLRPCPRRDASSPVNGSSPITPPLFDASGRFLAGRSARWF